jgi:4-amino-4-deoxy-L-arabinose transferase-like glycosyltransferase
VKRSHLAALLLWTALCGLFFLTIIAGLERLPASDFTDQFHTFASFQAREMAQGRLPLWSPHSFGGIPFVADPQSAVFYLPRWLTILVSMPGELPLYALELEAIFHIWLAGVFTYMLAYSVTSHTLAGLLAAIVFALGGYLTSYPLQQLAILETIVWLPLVLFLLRRGVSSANDPVNSSTVPWFVGAGLTLALSFTAGHPQTFVHISYLAAAYYLFLSIRARWRWTWILLMGVLTITLAFLVSAPAWLPAVRYASHTLRSDVGYDFVSSGQPMLHFVQSLVPGSITQWSPEYLGIAGLAFMLIAVTARHASSDQKAESVFWATTLLLALWISLGDAGVLFQLVYRVAPGFSLFRRQERLLGIATLSGAMLAAQGLALWLKYEGGIHRRQVRKLAYGLGVAFLVVAFVLLAAWPKVEEGWQPTLIRQIVIAALVLGLLFFRRWPRAQALLLILLITADLYAVSLKSIQRQPNTPAGFWQHPEWLDDLEADYGQDGPARIDTRSRFWANAGELYGWEDVSGISPLRPAVLERLDELPRKIRLSLLNVSHVIAWEPENDELLTPLFDLQEGLDPDRPIWAMVYRVEPTLPRAWMTYRSVITPDAESAFRRMKEPDFDPAAEVVLHTDVAGISSVQQPTEATPPEVTVQSNNPGSSDIHIMTEAPGFLVISEWFYPGWQAKLDGERVPIHPANYAFQTVLVPPGDHVVELRYKPPEVVAGITISLFALLAAVLLVRFWRPVVTKASTERRVRGLPKLPVPDLSKLSSSGLNRLPWLWLILAVILFGFSLRIYRLDWQELRGDEAFSYLFASQPAAGIIPDLLGDGDPHSPFHYLMLHGWMDLSGDSEFALRYISVMAGVLAIALMFQLGRQVDGIRLGMLLALLVAVSQSLVWVAQDVRNQYVLALMFALLATVVFARTLKKSNWKLWVLYAVACAATVYSHYYGLFALIGHGAYLVLMPATRKQWLAWIASVTGAVLLFLPWLVVMLPPLLEAGQLGEPSTPNLTRHLVTVGVELATGSALENRLARWLFVGLLLICVAGIRYLWRRQRAWTGLLLVWLLSAALGIYLVRFSRATFNAFYIVVAAPAWWTFIGLGILALWRRSDGRVRTVGILTLSITMLIAVFSLVNYYYDEKYSRSLGYREMAAQLAFHASPNDIFVAHYPDPSFDYYLRDVPLPRTMQPATYQDTGRQTDQDLAELAGQYDRLWFVPAHRSNWDPEDVAFRWLDYNSLLERETTHRRLTLSAYRPLSGANMVLSSLNSPIDDLLQLEGAYITVNGEPTGLSDGAPIQLQSEDTVEVSLVWEALSEIPADYTIFVHLLDGDGRLVAQHDGVPASGTRPTKAWIEGERILDKHRITMPSDFTGGSGSLVVGLYDSNTIERILFDDGRDHVPVAEVRFVVGLP